MKQHILKQIFINSNRTRCGVIYLFILFWKMCFQIFVAQGQEGTLKWSCTIPSGFTSLSSPAIGSDGTIYIVGGMRTLGPSGLLTFTRSGTKKWAKELNPFLSSSSPSIALDGTIYCGGLFAFTANGALKWVSYISLQDKGLPPAIGLDAMIYKASARDGLFAFTYNGTSTWNYKPSYLLDSLSPEINIPAIGSDGTIYFSTSSWKSASICALAPTGTLRWIYTTKNSSASGLAIGIDGSIYMCTDPSEGGGNVYAFTPSGNLKWSYTIGAKPTISSSPAVGSDGTIYVCSDSTKTLFFPTLQTFSFGKIYAFTPSGSLKWSYTTGGPIDSSPAIGSDGTIYFGSDDSTFYALNPSGSLKWRYKTSGKVHSSPAIDSDGTIYFTSDSSMLASMLYALNSSSLGGLAKSSWPMFQHDARHTGNLMIVSSVEIIKEDKKEKLPSSYKLAQNYPNPFNPTTTIRFDVPKIANVTIRIYDIPGREVRTLINRKLTPGSYEEIWDGKNNSRIPVASGIYLIRMHTEGFVSVKKMVMLK